MQLWKILFQHEQSEGSVWRWASRPSVKSLGQPEAQLTWVVHDVRGDPLRRDVGWDSDLLRSKGNLDREGKQQWSSN